MRLVVEAGADVNAINTEGCTALHLAAQNGFREIVEYLLSVKNCRFVLVSQPHCNIDFFHFRAHRAPCIASFVCLFYRSDVKDLFGRNAACYGADAYPEIKKLIEDKVRRIQGIRQEHLMKSKCCVHV
jgi:ankyrin repeat protein